MKTTPPIPSPSDIRLRADRERVILLDATLRSIFERITHLMSLGHRKAIVSLRPNQANLSVVIVERLRAAGWQAEHLPESQIKVSW